MRDEGMETQMFSILVTGRDVQKYSIINKTAERSRLGSENLQRGHAAS